MATPRPNAADVPAELSASVDRWFERADRDFDADTRARLARLVAVSDFAAGVLLRDSELLDALPQALDAPPDLDALVRFAEAQAASRAPVDEVKAALRRQRHRWLVQLLWRELAGLAEVDETLTLLSALADQLIAAAAGYAAGQMRERYGTVVGADGRPAELVVLAMGKLGGRELNYSSDVDLVFMWSGGGESDGPRALPAQTWFDRLSRQIIALLDETTADGFVFRVDTRLRPFGDSGPPVVSFAALESYLQQHGREWERYAYVKARIVGPAVSDALRRELMERLIRPFVYRRYLDYGVFESLREMHAMIALEVQQRELADNLKLGPGGIRELEFIVQSLQLVRGGARPELQTSSLLEALDRLAGSRGLDAAAAAPLGEAYRFLRRAENYLQAAHDKQTHELPADPTGRARLCIAMGMPDWAAFRRELDRHRETVTRQFNAITLRTDAPGDEPPDGFGKLWAAEAGEERWSEALAAAGFPDAAEIASRLRAFRDTSAARTADKLAGERLAQFMPRLIRLAQHSESPLQAIERSLAVIEQVLRRSAYLALLNENPLAAERLVRLCERSVTISRELARHPLLLDELLDPGVLSDAPEKAALAAELADRLGPVAGDDSESQMNVIAQFQRAVLFRVAVADFSGSLPIMKVSDGLTRLAEVVLDHALRAAWQDLAARHGTPAYTVDGERRPAGFAIVGYGKLGGIELSYGSDLDLVFLHDSGGEAQQTDGERPLDNAVFFSRLVRRLVHFLTTQTSAGALYEIDTRLRPSGRKGLLVSSAEAFLRYQFDDAWTWEHQALLRARPVAGDAALSARFERMRADILTRAVRRERLREDVLSMRARMREELDRSGDDSFDLKQGVGGIGDIEFLVQYLVLANAADQPAVYEFSDNIRQLDALRDAGLLAAGTADRLQGIYRDYRRRLHHLVLNGRPPLVPAGEFEAERAAVQAAWAGVFS